MAHLQQDFGRIALHEAMFDRSQPDSIVAEIVQLLVCGGSAVDAQDDKGHTSLMIASENGRAEAVEALIEARACVDLASNGGHTSLFCAAQNQFAEIVALLLAAGADPNFRSNDLQTPLMGAVFSSGKSDDVTNIVTQLVRAKSDCNLQDKFGMTAVSYAAKSGHDAAIRVLVMEGGASLSLQNKFGIRAVEVALAGSTTRALLEQMERDGADEIHLTKYAGHVAPV